MDEQEKKVTRQKIHYFKEHEITVHIILNSGQFYNGTIEEESADFFMLDDLKFGMLPVFYIQIKDVIPYRSMN